MHKKLVNNHPYIAYQKETYGPVESEKRALEFYNWLNTRRSVREFSEKPISEKLIENLILAFGFG